MLNMQKQQGDAVWMVNLISNLCVWHLRFISEILVKVNRAKIDFSLNILLPRRSRLIAQPEMLRNHGLHLHLGWNAGGSRSAYRKCNLMIASSDWVCTALNFPHKWRCLVLILYPIYMSGIHAICLRTGFITSCKSPQCSYCVCILTFVFIASNVYQPVCNPPAFLLSLNFWFNHPDCWTMLKANIYARYI